MERPSLQLSPSITPPSPARAIHSYLPSRPSVSAFSPPLPPAPISTLGSSASKSPASMSLSSIDTTSSGPRSAGLAGHANGPLSAGVAGTDFKSKSNALLDPKTDVAVSSTHHAASTTASSSSSSAASAPSSSAGDFNNTASGSGRVVYTQSEKIGHLQQIFSESQKIAYAGLCYLLILRFAERSVKPYLANSTNAYYRWFESVMEKLYIYLDIPPADRKMIRRLAEHGVIPSDLSSTLISDAKKAAERQKELEEAKQKSEQELLDQHLPPALDEAGRSSLDLDDDDLPSDIRYTILSHCFILSINDNTYDSRCRTLLRALSQELQVPWLDVIKLETTIADQLRIYDLVSEIREDGSVVGQRNKLENSKAWLFMGLATLAGGAVVGLTAGLAAPMIATGVGAALAHLGVAGAAATITTSTVASTAIIATGGAVTGGGMSGFKMLKRMRGIKDFEFVAIDDAIFAIEENREKRDAERRRRDRKAARLAYLKKQEEQLALQQKLKSQSEQESSEPSSLSHSKSVEKRLQLNEGLANYSSVGSSSLDSLTTDVTQDSAAVITWSQFKDSANANPSANASIGANSHRIASASSYPAVNGSPSAPFDVSALSEPLSESRAIEDAIAPVDDLPILADDLSVLALGATPATLDTFIQRRYDSDEQIDRELNADREPRTIDLFVAPDSQSDIAFPPKANSELESAAQPMDVSVSAQLSEQRPVTGANPSSLSTSSSLGKSVGFEVSADVSPPSLRVVTQEPSRAPSEMAYTESETLPSAHPDGTAKKKPQRAETVIPQDTHKLLPPSIRRQMRQPADGGKTAPQIKQTNVLITIAGWVTYGVDDHTLPFSTLEPNIYGDQYTLVWETKTLEELGSALKLLGMEVASFLFQKGLEVTVLPILMMGLTGPLWMLKLTYLLDNPWGNALGKAKWAGRVLADTLLQGAQENRPVTLVGFSLGARVIYYCLLELAEKGAFGIVEEAYMFGCPVMATKLEWEQIASVVSGRIVNGYLSNDWVLGVLYRASSAYWTDVAGLRPVQGVAGIENYQLNDIISGHLEYRVGMPKILARVGFQVTSDHFVDIEAEEEAQKNMFAEDRKRQAEAKRLEREALLQKKLEEYERKKREKELERQERKKLEIATQAAIEAQRIMSGKNKPEKSSWFWGGRKSATAAGPPSASSPSSQAASPGSSQSSIAATPSMVDNSSEDQIDEEFWRPREITSTAEPIVIDNQRMSELEAIFGSLSAGKKRRAADGNEDDDDDDADDAEDDDNAIVLSDAVIEAAFEATDRGLGQLGAGDRDRDRSDRGCNDEHDDDHDHDHDDDRDHENESSHGQ